MSWGGLRGQAQGFLKERMSLTEKLYRCGIKIGPRRKKKNSGSTAAALFQSGKWKMQLPVKSMQAITLVLTSKSQQSERKNRHTTKFPLILKAQSCLYVYQIYIHCRPAGGMCQHQLYFNDHSLSSLPITSQNKASVE